MAWLPACVAGRLAALNIATTQPERLPEVMGALNMLQVTRRKHLRPDWLPTSSGARVQDLAAEFSVVKRLPCGTEALRWVACDSCPQLHADWASREESKRSQALGFARVAWTSP